MEVYIRSNVSMDFERTPVYNITFQIFDGSVMSDIESLIIGVTDVNEVPSFTSSVYYITSAEAVVKITFIK